MTAYTLAARETVREIRESLSRQEPTLEVLTMELERAAVHLSPELGMMRHGGHLSDDYDLESIELWARLAADIAGLIQQKKRARP